MLHLKHSLGLELILLSHLLHQFLKLLEILKESWYRLQEVSPACTTDFRRVTLVNKERTERITFDASLEFTNPRTGREARLEDAVIIELKQDGRADSTMRRILLEHRVHPLRVSKYCMGTVLTDPTVHPGRFKEKIRGIEKITGNKTSR